MKSSGRARWAYVLIAVLLLLPTQVVAGFSTPWFSYAAGSAWQYPEGMKEPDDYALIGLWVMSEPMDWLDVFEGTKAAHYFSGHEDRGQLFLQPRLMLHEGGLADYWVMQQVKGFNEAYPKAMDSIGYQVNQSRLCCIYVTDSGAHAYYCPIFGVEICQECKDTGGHIYTVTDENLSLSYTSADGSNKNFVLTRWIPEANRMSANDAIKTYSMISVNELLPTQSEPTNTDGKESSTESSQETVDAHLMGLPAQRPILRDTADYTEGSIRHIAQTTNLKDQIWGMSDSTSGCYVSCVSMALSSLGIDMLPKDIVSNLKGSVYVSNYLTAAKKVGNPPLNIERLDCTEENILFMLERFRTNPNKYSPPLVSTKMLFTGPMRPLSHQILIIGVDKERNGYHILDSSYWNRTFGHVVEKFTYQGTSAKDNDMNQIQLFENVRQYFIP